jgi:hypothetical protein
MASEMSASGFSLPLIYQLATNGVILVRTAARRYRSAILEPGIAAEHEADTGDNQVKTKDLTPVTHPVGLRSLSSTILPLERRRRTS